MASDPIGHNNPPPSDEKSLFEAALLERHDKLSERQGDMEIAALDVPEEVKSDEDVAKVNGWVTQARQLARDTETARSSEKKPLIERGRWVDDFFGSISSPMLERAKRFEASVGAYLRAKEVARQAELQAEAARKRQLEEEARATAQREAEAAQKAEDEAEAARQKIADAAKEGDWKAQAAAEDEARDKQREADLSKAAAEQAEKDAASVSRSAERDERVAAKGGLGRTAMGGGAARLTTERNWRWAEPSKTLASLGPLGHYLTEEQIKIAIGKAMRDNPQPDIPGVAWYEDTAAKIAATRAK